MGNISTSFNWCQCRCDRAKIKITLTSDILPVQAGHSFPTHGLFQTKPPLYLGTALSLYQIPLQATCQGSCLPTELITSLIPHQFSNK